MMVYVLIIEDRHTDVEVRLFDTFEKAKLSAIDYLKDFDTSHVYPEDATMANEELADAGWLFYTCYSTEGDCVRILATEVN